MPLTDQSFWQEVAKWLAAGLSAVAVTFAGFVKWWVGDRFKQVEEDIDHVNDKVNSALQQTASHDVEIAEMRAFSKSTKEGMEKIDSKLDRLLERRRASP